MAAIIANGIVMMDLMSRGSDMREMRHEAKVEDTYGRCIYWVTPSSWCMDVGR
jgi:hypothetical protein